ncbi:alpha/beta fold hydrolase [Mycolicibacterium grossiae]|uniref:Alpha/beta hydrolase n=1 Tax=Mycolicibacterium grossiae TaxID=1552759 RepID=A0A1E8PVR8_9MYCO|nr:alpha/beta hydrolase [Mycolicibacterium grossiae]OFJ50301.1 alpha/beta hydrolase [Mycolicibacterium grossiae]QEM45372.1 alpha/beta hydrolase [Mycolicibacterium grossiae]
MTVHHRYAEVLGRRMFYREAGSPTAPTVVLLHGTPASSHMYRHLVPALADRYRVIAPDYPGFGHSDVPGTDEFDYTFDTLADHVDALLEQLGADRYALYVQDYGAPVGWRLALRHPERIAAIVTQNGNAYVEGFVGDAMEPLFAYGRDRTEANAAALRDLISPEGLKWQFTHGVSDPTVVDPDAWVNANAAVASTPERVAAQLELFADYSSNVDLYPTVHEYFRTSGVPLLAVWGRGDEIFGPDGALAFARDLPNAQINLLDGGHFLLESQLDAVVALMRPFLAAHLS